VFEGTVRSPTPWHLRYVASLIRSVLLDSFQCTPLGVSNSQLQQKQHKSLTYTKSPSLAGGENTAVG